MNSKLLIAASALAIIAGAPAFAESTNNIAGEQSSSPSIQQDIKRGWEDTKEAASDTYEDIKATLIGDEQGTNAASSTVVIDSRATAAGMIGKPVENTKGEKIATIKDIILDASGKATTVVLADGGFMGIGTKLAAFDYNLVSQRQEDGDVIMPISEETLDKVVPFSYDPKDAEKDSKVRIIPADGVSVAEFLDGQILNPKNENVAEIDNISFRDGEASQIIIAFDQTLGLGGEKAAMSYDTAKLIRSEDEIDVQLSAAQAANFESFKKTNTN